MSRAWLLTWVVVSALIGGGCGRGMLVNARVVEPAGVPVRAFPHVWIEGGQLPVEQELAQGLAAYLQQTANIAVRLLDADEIAAARAGGVVPAATVVLSLRLQTNERSRVEWATRPETVCDALGCFTVNRSYNYDVPVLEGELSISVADGQTSQVLQRAVLKAREEGRNYDDMLPRLALALAARLQQVTEQRVLTVQVTLLDVDHPDVSAALVSAKQGQWRDARGRLEAFVESAAFAQLDAEAQARALYDLAQARRFGARQGESALELLKGARALLQRALSLAHDTLYAEAITDFDHDIERRRMVDDQRAAAAHNFAIAPSTVPPPPSATETQGAPPPVTDVTPQTP